MKRHRWPMVQSPCRPVCSRLHCSIAPIRCPWRSYKRPRPINNEDQKTCINMLSTQNGIQLKYAPNKYWKIHLKKSKPKPVHIFFLFQIGCNNKKVFKISSSCSLFQAGSTFITAWVHSLEASYMPLALLARNCYLNAVVPGGTVVPGRRWASHGTYKLEKGDDWG